MGKWNNRQRAVRVGIKSGQDVVGLFVWYWFEILRNIYFLYEEFPNSEDEDSENQSNSDEKLLPYQKELEKLRSHATDFKLRFCGHCNTTTDIKEANFFGRYILNISCSLVLQI